MSRKSLAGVLAVVVGVLALWLLVFHRRHAAPAKAPAKPPAQQAARHVAAAARHDEPRAPRGRAPAWTLDADPEGPLRLEGQVLDDNGAGVAGAEVWLQSVPPRHVKTQDDGTFAFDRLVGRQYTLTAVHGGQVGGPVEAKLTATSDPVVITLRDGVTIDVTVADDHARPIAHAEVRVPGDGSPSATTDDQGHASLAGAQPGWISVEAHAAGYAPGSTFTSIGSAGGRGKAAITLRRGAAVSGRVVDEAGHALAKVKVADDGVAGSHGDTQTTDEQGRFAFPALAPGRHTLSAIDGEHAPTSSNPITVVVDRPVAGVELVMKAGAVVSGTVVDTAGKAAAFATVRVLGKGAQMWRTPARQATTDSAGKFELRGLARARLQARAESDTSASAIVDLDLTARAERRGLKLVLDVGGTIEGVVVDSQGQPVPEVEVNAFPDVLGGQSPDSIALAGLSPSTTDGGGRFAIHGLPDGAYRLWAARHASLEEGWGQHSTPAKVGDTNVKIVMPAPGQLVGHLALEGGATPAMAYVEVGMQPATPAIDGAFRIEDLAPGAHDLRVFGPGFSDLVKRDVQVEAGKTTDLGTLTVLRGRRLDGRVVDSSGTPVAGARVKLGELLFSGADDSGESDATDALSGIRTATTDQDGTFELVGVPAKATTVMADHPDRGRSLPLPVPAGTDDPPPIVLALQGYGSISGKVTQRGEPVAGAVVSEAAKGGGAAAAFAKTGADGTFVMPKVPAGTHVLTAIQSQMMAMKSTSVTVEVAEGKPSQVTIDIPLGQVSLDVQVQALPGNVVNAAQVFLFQGTVAITTGKDLESTALQGALQGMKFWFGVSQPSFDQLVPGSYSVCTIPITGDLSDPTFLGRVQQNVQTLAVYCKPVTVAPSPVQQTFVDAVPAMTPLPAPKG